MSFKFSTETEATVVSGKFYPWLESKPDFEKHTGGDWFSMLLQASMGNKPIHGANTSATCEVLCKAKSTDGISDGFGCLRWDTKIKKAAKLGSDISDQHFLHHHYRGTITSSGNIMAYETGAWEPSLRTRARATSLLAAGIHAHGCSREDAIRTVSVIASDEIDEEAVESTLVPASHLKREMTIISKANHRIFSRGTIQKSIIWDDSRLSLGAYSSNVAFDWGRVTAIARYIAEANIQVCPDFRRVARNQGLLYFIVRNSWAYVSPTDYHLYPELFASVPKVDLSKYNIPSLRGAFIDHEQDILIAVTRSLDTLTVVPDSDTLRAYQRIYKSAKARRARKEKMVIATTEQYREVDYTSYNESIDTRVSFIDKSQVPWKALVKAIATRRAHDEKIKEVVNQYYSKLKEPDEIDDITDTVTQMLLDKATWILARGIIEEMPKPVAPSIYPDLNDDELSIVMRLSRLKATMFDFPSHIESPVYFTNSTLVKLRGYTRALLVDSERDAPLERLTQTNLASMEFQETSRVIGELRKEAEDLLPKLNNEVSKTFKEWANRMFDMNRDDILEEAIRFYFVATTLENLDVFECLHKSSGYVDGSRPMTSFVFRAVKKLSKRLDFPKPSLKRLTYSNVHQIVTELDHSGSVPFVVADAVRYTLGILDRVIGDLMVGELYKPSNTLYEEVFIGKEIPGSPGYDTACMTVAEDEAFLATIEREYRDLSVPILYDDHNSVLNTYPNPSIANKWAKLNGYENFKKAYESLKAGASYSTESEYGIKALEGITLETSRPSPIKRKRGYQSMV